MNYRKGFSRLAGWLVLALLQPGWRPGMAAQPASAFSGLRVDSAELAEIGTDSVQLRFHLSAISRDSVTLRDMTFDGVSVNGIRLKIQPISGPVRLHSGEPVDGLGRLRAVLTYRELDSLDPLRRIIREGSADVHAFMRARLELTLFQKLALMAPAAWVHAQFDGQAPVTVPGGPLQRAAAEAALLVADPLWIMSRGAVEWRRNRSALAETVRRTCAGQLVRIDTRYQLKSGAGETAAVSGSFLGIMAGGGRILAPAEAVEPWRFEDSVAEALDHGGMTIERNLIEVIATPLDENSNGRSFSLSRKELRVARKLEGGENVVSRKGRHHLRFRNADDNLVLLEIAGWRDAGAKLRIDRTGGSHDWQLAVVARVDRPGAAPALWVTEARLEDGRYRLKDAVDAASFGSPVWLENGVAAMVQDESSAAEIGGVLKRLHWENESLGEGAMRSCPACLNLSAETSMACDFCGAVLHDSVIARAEGGGARTPTVYEEPPRRSSPPRPSPPPPRPSPPPPLPGSEVRPGPLAGRRGVTEYAPPQPANAPLLPRAASRKIIGILVSYSWKPEGQVFPVREGRNLIGRGDHCEIRVTEDASLSWENSHITFRKNFVVGDLASMSGTDLNGEPIEEQFRPLANYARIRTGTTHWTFVVIDPELAERYR